MNKLQIFAFADEASGNVDEQIKALQRNNLNGLEIRNVDGTNISEISLQKAAEVKKKLDDAGLKTWSIGSPIGKINIETDDFAKHLETFKHSLELSAVLEADCFRLFSFYLPFGKNPSDYRNEVMERMGTFCDLAKGYSVTLCHENEKGIYGDIPERCLELHQSLPELMGIFDPANYIQCNVDTLQGWKLLKPYIKYMHIKDALAEGAVVPAGKGVGNVPAIVKDFVADGGNAFTIEPHLTIFDGFANLEKGGESAKDRPFVYENSNAAFDAACEAFQSILTDVR